MKTRVLAALGMAAALAACGDSTGLGAGEPTVSLTFATAARGAANLSRAGFALGGNMSVADTLVDGADTLVISRVEIVLREIELKRVNHSACDSLPGDDDSCEEFEVGPMLVDLPLSGAVQTPITIAIDTGSYDEIEFDIHKPSDDDAEDRAFVLANPDFAETSIRVQGTFNGQPFTYETDLNVEQEIDLPTPLVITETTLQTNVTLRVDLDAWFRANTGALVNPQTANKGGLNEGLVKDNIKDSVEAFEDEDRDGDDEDEDDS